jgi:hypothetical protein
MVTTLLITLYSWGLINFNFENDLSVDVILTGGVRKRKKVVQISENPHEVKRLSIRINVARSCTQSNFAMPVFTLNRIITALAKWKKGEQVTFSPAIDPLQNFFTVHWKNSSFTD